LRCALSEIIADDMAARTTTEVFGSVAATLRTVTLLHKWNHRLVGCSTLFVHAFGTPIDVTIREAIEPKAPGDLSISIDAPFKFLAEDMLRGLRAVGLRPATHPKFEIKYPFGNAHGLACVLVHFDIDDFVSCLEQHNRQARGGR
jgi:hypothetical protein